MTREAKTLLLLAAVVLAFALGGCSSDDSDGDYSYSGSTMGSTIDDDMPITDEEISAQAVILTVRQSPSQYPRFSSGSDDYIEQVARLVCEGFDNGVTFLGAVNAVAEGAGTDPMEAAHFVGASVGGMCAEYASVVGRY